ncbi:hypothetical protein [Caldovatus aquaticus]|uniref:Uncharacterized protein n=1 Tax=Caldovatus aquaticus TaxID=2865671 RepID=A0ABS7F6H1_9PROT|nr:hypothetical protein [Caldovatus aquaticus]MBW8271218.1 hypothetical protein [Caldovatus aquaticus]
MAEQLAEAVANGRVIGPDLSEAQARLALLQLDAPKALEALAALVAEAEPQSEQRQWAERSLSQLTRLWHLVLTGMPAGAERLELQRRAEAALAGPIDATAASTARVMALADVLAHGRRPGAERELLERTLAAGCGGFVVWQRLLAALLGELQEAPSPAAIARALAPPPAPQEMRGASSGLGNGALDLLRYRLQCAVVLASLRWGLDRIGEARWSESERALAAALSSSRIPPWAFAIELALQQALAPIARMPVAAAARHLILLARGRFPRLPGQTRLWTAPVSEAEEARRKIVEAMLNVLKVTGMPAAQTLAMTLMERLPETRSFWEDEIFRKDVCSFLLVQVNDLPDPARSRIRALCGIGLRDWPTARANFATLAALEPTAIGATSYCDPEAVPALLSRPEDKSLKIADLRWEVLRKAESVPAGPVIVTSGNAAYLRRFGPPYAAALREALESAAHPPGVLHLHLIGEPEKERDTILAIAEALPGFSVTLSYEPVCVEASYWFATARFLRLSALRSRSEFADRTVVVTDFDHAWTEPPAAFLARAMPGADVGLRLGRRVAIRSRGGAKFELQYPLLQPWWNVSAHCVAVAPNANGQRFAAILSRVAEAALHDALMRDAAGQGGEANWGIDQAILFAVHRHVESHHPEIAIADLLEYETS